MRNTISDSRLADDAELLATALGMAAEPAIGMVRGAERGFALVLHESSKIADLFTNPNADCLRDVPNGPWVWFAGAPSVALALADPPVAFAFDTARNCPVELVMPIEELDGVGLLLREARIVLTSDLPSPHVAEVALMRAGSEVRMRTTLGEVIELEALHPDGPTETWLPCDGFTLDVRLGVEGTDIFAHVQYDCVDSVLNDFEGQQHSSQETMVWREGGQTWLPVSAETKKTIRIREWHREESESSDSVVSAWHTAHGAFLHTRTSSDNSKMEAFGEDEDGWPDCETTLLGVIQTEHWEFVNLDGERASLTTKHAFEPSMESSCDALLSDAVEKGRIDDTGGGYMASARPRAAPGARLGQDFCTSFEVPGLHQFRVATETELLELHRDGAITDDVYLVGSPMMPFLDSWDLPPEATLVLGQVPAPPPDAVIVCLAP